MAAKNAKHGTNLRRTSDFLADADDAEERAKTYERMSAVERMKPKDQVRLSAEELEEEMPSRVLYPLNSQAPQNVTVFSFKEMQFKRSDQVDHTTFHFSADSDMWLKETTEAIALEEEERLKEDRIRERRKKEYVDIAIENDNATFKSQDAAQRRNQFSYSDKAAQTFNSLIKERGISTKPPPTTDFCDTVNQWIIYDAYVDDLHNFQAKEEVAKKHESEDDSGAASTNVERDLYSADMKYAIKLTERLVNQNSENEIFFDFKYYEDKADAFRNGEGTLLPLWHFASERAKRKHVTAIKWNPRYDDLFAVSFGIHDFSKTTPGGAICCYTLKNSSHPEYIFNTECGVCCLDWYAEYPSLLAAGLYDGTVVVYDVQSKTRKPIYQSSIRTNKHLDPVWEVCWNSDKTSGSASFNSISADGRVTAWLLMKNKLEPEEILELKFYFSKNLIDSEVEQRPALSGLSHGTCFDFHPLSPHLFLVGTEEGTIHKCSKAYSGHYLETYEGHDMAVYTVRWSPFHPKLFISASADWTVKLWRHTSKAPIAVFDLGHPVADVAWAPYSSTVFASATSDGWIHVYDLSENRRESMGHQKLSRKNKLTKLCFNKRHPVVLVGDDRGSVDCFKLSPNLRKTIPSTGDAATDLQKQIDRMNSVLSMMVDSTNDEDAANNYTTTTTT